MTVGIYFLFYFSVPCDSSGNLEGIAPVHIIRWQPANTLPPRVLAATHQPPPHILKWGCDLHSQLLAPHYLQWGPNVGNIQDKWLKG